VLAAIGLYGITAYTVARRGREIGIRTALGTTPNGIVCLVISRLGRLVAAGVASGAVVSVWASKFAASLLYGVQHAIG
jgi:ABC-type antimicrobial peptide transport system permease subunit